MKGKVEDSLREGRPYVSIESIDEIVGIDGKKSLKKNVSE